jgi:hypothetical protein
MILNYRSKVLNINNVKLIKYTDFKSGVIGLEDSFK